MSIKDINEKIKPFFLVALLILSSTLAFGLGRLSVLEGRRESVKIELPDLNTSPPAPNLVIQEAAETTSKTVAAGAVVASRSGAKYHFPWCGSAKSIKPENKITFPTEAAAVAAGYSLAKNCK